MRAPVSAVLIVRNEEAQLRACLESLRPHVEELVVVDTGSTDRTAEIARDYADTFDVFEACNDAEGRIADFSLARNYAFSLASKPWVLWVDGDDEVEHGEQLAKLVETYDAARAGRPCSIMMPYVYVTDELGNATSVHDRERLVCPKEAFQWEDPVHEVLVPKEPGALIVTADAVSPAFGIRVMHRRQGKPHDKSRNLRILRSHYEKHGAVQSRWLYYLGREYSANGDLGQAIAFHRAYVDRSTWDDEACLSCLEIARHYIALGDFTASVEWAFKAVVRREQWAEPYLALGRAFYHLARRGGPEEHRHWERAAHFLGLGTSLPATKTMLFVNPLERAHEAHKYLNVALNKLGRIEDALASCTKALAVRPDEDLAGNRKLYIAHLARRQIDRELDVLLEHERITTRQAAAVREALDAPEKTSKQAGAEPGRFEPSSHHGQPRAEDAPPSPVGAENGPEPLLSGSAGGAGGGQRGLDIVVFVGEACEPWTPATARARGIGGSETAVIEMTQRWAAAGHQVRVYGDCLGREGDYDGVSYVHHTNFRRITCDVLVSSRRADGVDGELCTARAKLVWVHDVHLGDRLTHARAIRTDRFLCLSNWHRETFLKCHPQVHPSQVLVTRNGIDLERFESAARTMASPRNPHRAIYSSSPDRGLEELLVMWPRIRGAIPDAELEVFYGFDTWEAMADEEQRRKIAALKVLLRIRENQGVRFLGRVSQEALALHMVTSGVWLYPTWFTETSCISAMEAQAAGLRIVTSDLAALTETVGGRGVLIKGDRWSREYQLEFVSAATAAMRGAGLKRQWIQAEARARFGWDSVAADWLDMFRDVIESVERDVMPPYQPAPDFAAARRQ